MVRDSDSPKKARGKDDNDDLFTGRGSPAFMSPSEPAISLLKRRYNETFAFTKGTEKRVHLFMIKSGLWSLVWTFPLKKLESEDIGTLIVAALAKTESALKGEDAELLANLDAAVLAAESRTDNLVERYRSGKKESVGKQIEDLHPGSNRSEAQTSSD
jgi:hypothetical protein